MNNLDLIFALGQVFHPPSRKIIDDYYIATLIGNQAIN
jgi:hypothetical protein